jgi:hypothetical protein
MHAWLVLKKFPVIGNRQFLIIQSEVDPAGS